MGPRFTKDGQELAEGYILLCDETDSCAICLPVYWDPRLPNTEERKRILKELFAMGVRYRMGGGIYETRERARQNLEHFLDEAARLVAEDAPGPGPGEEPPF